MSICLTRSELRDLTGYKRRRQQMEALVYMGVQFRTTPIGDVKVMRSAVESRTGVERYRGEPDYEAI